jgi:glycosyltransferase involved in cell wall biosynthesis
MTLELQNTEETHQVLQIISGLSPRFGGPSYSVPRLCAALQATHWRPTLMTVKMGGHTSPGALEFAHAFPSAPLIAPLRASPDLRRGIRLRAPSVSVIHNHGLWLMPNVYAGLEANRAGKPLVVSPRGMLAAEALSFSRHKKAVFWRLLQGPAFSKASAWHATSAQEADEIRRFGIEAPIAIIQNGVDLPDAGASHDGQKRRRTVIFVSRLHPKKGLPSLIEAWGKVSPQRPEWDLVIAGPDEDGHRAQIEKLAHGACGSRIRFMDEVTPRTRDTLYADADLFVLPTLNENFGLAVAEALAAGLPAIVTKGAPWSKLISERCGWWIDHGAAPLESALIEATALPPVERAAMGARGRALMEREYSWSAAARQMAQLYTWLVGEGDKPRFVQTAIAA